MTRNWIATASRTLRMIGSGPARACRRRTSPCLENLETRLSLSSFAAGGVVGTDLNPQPLPPRIFPVLIASGSAPELVALCRRLGSSLRFEQRNRSISGLPYCDPVTARSNSRA
jgi:hypothetical protein